jgi:hypothetical protein
VILVDVNVLVYGFREDASGHARYLNWWEQQIASPHAFGIADLVLSGFLRIVTHPRVFDPPSPLEDALRFVERLKRLRNYVEIRPGPRHWDIFVDLCRRANSRGNLAPDAYLAALAIESGSEWITTDRDFGRFPDLRWRHPLE